MITLTMDEARQILWRHVLRTLGGVDPGDSIANAPELCKFVCKVYPDGETLTECDSEEYIKVDRVEIKTHDE